MIVYSDSIRSKMQYGLQDRGTRIAEGIMKMHHDLLVVMIFIVIGVGWILGRIYYKFRREGGKGKIVERRGHSVWGTVLEIVWTIIRGIILGGIAVRSFGLLYAIEEVVHTDMTVKIVGHQWYWSYEYSDGGSRREMEFDSYLVGEEELEEGGLRLLEVDNKLLLRTKRNIRLIVTSGDVLHSFAVRSFGVKIDACRGRINEVSLWIKRRGVYYGQCSELCGVNHGFMRIAIESLIRQHWGQEASNIAYKLDFLRRMRMGRLAWEKYQKDVAEVRAAAREHMKPRVSRR